MKCLFFPESRKPFTATKHPIANAVKSQINVREKIWINNNEKTVKDYYFNAQLTANTVSSFNQKVPEVQREVHVKILGLSIMFRLLSVL